MLVAGIMSGTSLDGIDVALVEIEGAGLGLRARSVGFHVGSFPEGVRGEILAVSDAEASAARISQLDFLLGTLFGEAVVDACRRSGIPVGDVDLVGSHGQTVYHQAEPAQLCGRGVSSTFQIGEPACIARAVGAATVSDFRPADVAAGGHGAPLVPFADYLLFRDPAANRVALNIGGIANLTAIPAGASPESVAAFDTGPGNMVIDSLVASITDGAERFDRNGRIAARSRVDEALLAELLADPYFALPAPKSTGRERYGSAYAARLLERAPDGGSAVATATELTARTVVEAIDRLVRPSMPVDELVVSGGGWQNPAIVGSIRAGLPGTAVRPSDDLGVPHDAKEAVAFALLAHETFHGRPSNLPSATGASGPVVLGKITPAPC